MTAIIFSRITALGSVVDVFSLPEIPTNINKYLDRRDKSVITAFLYPSRTADVALTAYTSDAKGATHLPPSQLAAALFLGCVRGLPLEEFSIEIPGKILNIDISPITGKVRVKAPKCKILFTKRQISIENTTVSYSGVLDGNSGKIINVYSCDSVDNLSESVLSALAFSSNAEPVCAAVAVSDRTQNARIHTVSHIDSKLLTAATALHVATRLPKINLEGTTFVFENNRAEITVSDPNPTVHTLFAPDP